MLALYDEVSNHHVRCTFVRVVFMIQPNNVLEKYISFITHFLGKVVLIFNFNETFLEFFLTVIVCKDKLPKKSRVV